MVFPHEMASEPRSRVVLPEGPPPRAVASGGSPAARWGRCPGLVRRAVAAVVAGGLVVVAVVAGAACGGSELGPAKAVPASAVVDRRETDITHDACDVRSSSAERVDVNADGRPEVIRVKEGGREICRAIDLNFDGNVDTFVYFDAEGKERRRESDFDRDGRADEIVHLNAGLVALKERETNFDNKIDTWDHYEAGRLVRRERDTNADGIVDQWWTFEGAGQKCAKVISDRNGDGRPDQASLIDTCATEDAPKDFVRPSASGSAAPTATPAAPGATVAPTASVAPPPSPVPATSASSEAVRANTPERR